MENKNYIKELLEKRKKGIHCGIPSFCSSNKLVIEAVLEEAIKTNDCPVIESTSNQVNQYGGYTKMKPADFVNYVKVIADRVGFDMKRIVIGGDHLGPLPWYEEDEEYAMKEAEVLVRQCVAAGYTKIHLDTSMRLGSDSKDEPLSDDVIARRGARLYAAAEDEFAKYKKEHPDAIRPVYVIGSEVPVPGGAKRKDSVEVTTPAEFVDTIAAYRKAFLEQGITDAWENIIAVVVQPGVEFGNEGIHEYCREDAKNLCHELYHYSGLVFEGHSTDYQSQNNLKLMVEDGIAILKVGPALTFALREGLFSLAMIEKELIDEDKQSHFIEILEEEMVKNPKYWVKYYFGTEKEKRINRKYGLSDRSRYYMALPVVEDAIETLLANLRGVDIPRGVLKQFMPIQYALVNDDILPSNDPRMLLKECVKTIIKDYNYAARRSYIIEESFK